LCFIGIGFSSGSKYGKYAESTWLNWSVQA